MKIFFLTGLSILLFVSTAICQISEKTENRKCLPNSEKLYDRKKVTKRLAEILNKSIPERKDIYKTGYDITDEGSPAGFFIYDLTDISNKDITSSGCIEFKENHIYHFAPFDNNFSFSHILFLEKGKLKVFKSINCKERGDSLESVLSYLKQKLVNENNKEEILNRVKNYRQYGKYLKMDSYSSPVCQKTGENIK